MAEKPTKEEANAGAQTEGTPSPGAGGGGGCRCSGCGGPRGDRAPVPRSRPPVPWDPTQSWDWDKQRPGPQALARITREVLSVYKEPPAGMFIEPDLRDLTKMHVLVTGPADTPYQGGFFLFFLRFPPDYPIHPPRVRLMTTGYSVVRFNPNFYNSGKVCLSILGTWEGPAWSPAYSVFSVLISIQALMDANPYYNEPGFEQEKPPVDSENYNEYLRHETIRVAVCDMLEGGYRCPKALRDAIERSFMENYDFYVGVCKDRLHLQGKQMQEPFGEEQGPFDYQSLLDRVESLRRQVRDKRQRVAADPES